MKFLSLFLLFFSTISANEQIHYSLYDEPIDVVIPCHVKDQEILQLCIEGVKQNGSQVRRVITVSDKPYTSDAEWFDESLFPFTKEEIGKRLFKSNVVGSHLSKYRVICWIYQQLLKFYAPLVIPEISSNVLILDADTVFLNPVNYTNENNGSSFNISHCDEVGRGQLCYFKHMKRLIPGLMPFNPLYDPICHFMLFQRSVIDELFNRVESAHETPFWIAFCDCFDWLNPRVSEYQIYFSFALTHSNQMSVYELKWENDGDLDRLEEYKTEGYHYISHHKKL